VHEQALLAGISTICCETKGLLFGAPCMYLLTIFVF